MKKSLSDDSLNISKSRKASFITTIRRTEATAAGSSTGFTDGHNSSGPRRVNGSTRTVKHVKFEQLDDIEFDDVSPQSSPFSGHAGSSSSASSSTTSSTPRIPPSGQRSASVMAAVVDAQTTPTYYNHHHHSSKFLKRVMSSIEFHQNVVDTSSTFASGLEHDEEQFVTNKFEVII